MNLTELSGRLTTARDVLRVETLPAYNSTSDHDWLRRFLTGEPQPDIEHKRPWLDRLTAAADNGRPWRRLRLVPDPVSDYFRYACEWSYTDNSAAGELVRILDRDTAPRLHADLTADGDFLVLDGAVVVMHYDGTGTFTSATDADSADWWSYEADAASAWSVAVPFVEWWARHPDLHRNLVGS